VIWNWLPGQHEFGTGDSYHTTNDLPSGSMYTHLAETLHCYGRSQPECAALARWMMGAIPEGRYSGTWPVVPFLLTRIEAAPEARPPAETLPPARNFEGMGQVFMRSGSGPDDTYALFTCGGTLEMHRHYDNSNFVIYRKGFLALDTGTRPEPGQHLTHYYCRTVAHNCVLINMAGEDLPRYWGGPAPGEEPLPVPNDGGQDKVSGSKLLAFETGPEYTYVAGDATPCYNALKCSLATRQIVFVPPDHFAILDRVTSTRPEYRKTWVLHTAREPEVQGPLLRADQGEGRIFCRTLLPERAELRKVGGPGKQFWSDGRNWPLPADWRTRDDVELLGQWRVEVSPAEARTDDVFLHLIQVGDRARLETMGPCELLGEDGRVGVRFAAGDRNVWVLFSTAGDPGGRIRIVGPEGVLADRDLTHRVTPQVGLLARER
jgi:heparin/heparan-sulfate lyase